MARSKGCLTNDEKFSGNLGAERSPDEAIPSAASTARRRCSLYVRLFDSRAPTTFYSLAFLLRLLPPCCLSSFSSLLWLQPSLRILLVLSSRASSFSSAFLPYRTGSLHRTIAAESFRLEIFDEDAFPPRCPILPRCLLAPSAYHPPSRPTDPPTPSQPLE